MNDMYQCGRGFGILSYVFFVEKIGLEKIWWDMLASITRGVRDGQGLHDSVRYDMSVLATAIQTYLFFAREVYQFVITGSGC